MAFQVMLYQLSAYCISDIGLVRQNNEDFSKMLKEEQFFVLADGMGGHQAGEIASKETVERLCQSFKEQFNYSHKELSLAKILLKKMIQEVNTTVYRLGQERVEFKGMGTTICCIFFHSEGLIYAHVGDSRIYRLRQGHLKQLTQDHSLMRELIDLGQLSEQQANEFLYKNIITRAIGTELFVEPSIAHTSIEVGDVILMCTDGLTDLVNFEEIQEILNQNSEKEAAQALVRKAKQRGGYDNITVVLVKVKEKNESHLS